MTIEEIERVLLTVAENQAKHASDIAQIDRGIEALLQSQNRYESMLSRQNEILNDLADRQLKTEERFAELAAAQAKSNGRLDRIEATLEMLTEFVRLFKTDTERKIDQLDKRDDQIAEHLDRVAALQAENAEQIKALTAAQVRTEERINQLFERGGN